MTHSSNIQIPVALSEANWRAILEILHAACQLKGGNWVQWEESINRTIQTAIGSAHGRLPEFYIDNLILEEDEQIGRDTWEGLVEDYGYESLEDFSDAHD